MSNRFTPTITYLVTYEVQFSDGCVFKDYDYFETDRSLAEQSPSGFEFLLSQKVEEFADSDDPEDIPRIVPIFIQPFAYTPIDDSTPDKATTIPSSLLGGGSNKE